MLWSCLDGDHVLTGTDAKSVKIRNALTLVADESGSSSLDQVIFAWPLSLPCQALPIIGYSQIERIKTAVDAEKYRLSREQWYAIWEASTGYKVP